MNQGETMNIIKYVMTAKPPLTLNTIDLMLLRKELARLIEAEAELLSREDDDGRA